MTPDELDRLADEAETGPVGITHPAFVTLARQHAALLRWADEVRRCLSLYAASRSDEVGLEPEEVLNAITDSLAALDAVKGGHQ